MEKRKLFPLIALSIALSSCSGRQSQTLSLPKTSQASVHISIRVPKATPSSQARKPLYISSNTATATVMISQPGLTTTSTSFACNSTNCGATVSAPFGADTFAITLLDGSGVVLSQGVMTQTIAAGTNTVNVSFNPIVKTVSLSLDSTAVPPYLSSIGPSGVNIDVNLLDPDNVPIIGGGALVPFNNPSCDPTANSCLTITLKDSDTATTVTPSSFATASPSGLKASLILTAAQGTIPPFDDPTITVTAPGVPNVSGLSVPVSPVVPTSDDIPPLGGVNGNGKTASGTPPQMTSVFGEYALQLNQYIDTPSGDPDVSDLMQYQYDPEIRLLTAADNNSSSHACCAPSPIMLTANSQSQVQSMDHLLGNLSAPPSLASNSADEIAWFVDEGDHKFSVADITNSTVVNDLVQTIATSGVQAAIADGNKNVWYGFSDGSVLNVADFNTSTVTNLTPQSPALLTSQSGAYLVGLVNAPTLGVLAVVSIGSQTVIYTLSANGNSAPTITKTSAPANVNLQLSVNARNASSVNQVLPVAGYSTLDKMVYVSDAVGTLYRIDPSTGASVAVPLSGMPAASADPNRLPMTLLSDGSLAYEGTTNDPLNGPFLYVHVLPGQSPSATSVTPACTLSAQTTQCAYQLWSIGAPPPASPLGGPSLFSTDGGHTLGAIW